MMMESPTIVPLQQQRPQNILATFLRRPRGASQTSPLPSPVVGPENSSSSPPSPPQPTLMPPPLPPSTTTTTTTTTSPSPTTLGLSMLRRRSNGAPPPPPTPTVNTASSTSANTITRLPPPAPNVLGSKTGYTIKLVPHLDSRRTLKFEPIARTLSEGAQPLRIGRFTDRSGLGLAAANALGSSKLAFKSKVVSRAHAEIWVESGGKFMVKDTKSSSGTFLNHVRLSPANMESKPHQIKDGDILQLGVDYQGGTEDIYKSVKIRLEIGRDWQHTANPFNTNALNQLKNLNNALAPAKKGSKKSSISDCCICLFTIAIRQALFIAPCSHTFHYKCIRPLLETHDTSFSCPLCRTYADLEADVEYDPPEDEDEADGSEDEAAALAAVEKLEAATAIASTSSVVAALDGATLPHAHHRHHSRKDHSAGKNEAAGAETEVEADVSVSVGGSRRRDVSRPFVVLESQSDDNMLVDDDDLLDDVGDDDDASGSAEQVDQLGDVNNARIKRKR